MRKSLHQGTKADVQKRKELHAKLFATLIPQEETKPLRRIVTFNHPWVNQC